MHFLSASLSLKNLLSSFVLQSLRKYWIIIWRTLLSKSIPRFLIPLSSQWHCRIRLQVLRLINKMKNCSISSSSPAPNVWILKWCYWLTAILTRTNSKANSKNISGWWVISARWGLLPIKMLTYRKLELTIFTKRGI